MRGAVHEADVVGNIDPVQRNMGEKVLDSQLLEVVIFFLQ
jgi:hypothetical protein